jgi:hypothetical protein
MRAKRDLPRLGREAQHLAGAPVTLWIETLILNRRSARASLTTDEGFGPAPVREYDLPIRQTRERPLPAHFDDRRSRRQVAKDPRQVEYRQLS